MDERRFLFRFPPSVPCQAIHFSQKIHVWQNAHSPEKSKKSPYPGKYYVIRRCFQQAERAVENFCG